MPRSKKKKPRLKDSLKYLEAGFSGNATPENILMQVEQNLMINRAIASANKHGINLSPGRLNSANGNCAFESSIFNNNDRKCFKEKFHLSPDYYRRVWLTDMKNRTMNDKTWQIYSDKEWEAGWKEMLDSGVYERGIFGDLMLLGISCGLRKFLLIFNTSLDSPHDPIYVCDPRKFGVIPDTEVPVVLAYNMSHYESLHPSEDSDIEKIVTLVQQYLTGQYAFGKHDLPFLLSSDSGHHQSRISDEPIIKDQESLPDHLRGRRPSEMNKDEKIEYNFHRRKFKKLNVKECEDVSGPCVIIDLDDKVKDPKDSKKLKVKVCEEVLEECVIIDLDHKVNDPKDSPHVPTLMQESLPEYLRGRRRKDMNTDEKREYDNLRRKIYRTNESKGCTSKRNKRNAESNAAKRARETTDKRKERIEKVAKANASNRLNKIPPSQYEARNAKKVMMGEQIVLELKQTEDTIGKMNVICEFCKARKWKNETPTLCCNSGKIILTNFPDPPEFIRDLLTKSTEEGKLFRKHARSLNNALALSSLQVNVRQFIGGFTPCIVFEGKVSQRIGPLIPEAGEEPKFAQLYVLDPGTEQTIRVQNMNLPKKMTKKEIMIITNILLKLQVLLKEINPYVKDLMHICEIPDNELSEGKLVISCKDRPMGTHQRQYNTHQSLSEVSVLTNSMPGDMVLRKRGGGLQQIYDIHPSAQPLHFILLFPFGTKGYHELLKQKDDIKRISPREFFAFHINMRCPSSDYLFLFARLFQEYLCLAFTTMESQRLKYQRDNQKALRADTFKNIRDVIDARVPLGDRLSKDDHNLKIGKRIILSSSFPGGPRWYNAKFQDGMAICRKFRKPDFFITMTCNPYWDEIKRELRESETVQDRPDLVSRVFKLKKDQLMKDISAGRILGRVPAFLWVIEFQKRGLPHAHILVILNDDDRPITSDEIDDVVSARLPPDPADFVPNSEEQKQAIRLQAIVLKNMVHGPCGKFDPSAPCMEDGKCSKGFPKQYSEKTIIRSENSYPEYQRLEPAHGGRSVVVDVKSKQFIIDDRWIVPYSPYLCLRFNCHINFEPCMSPTAAKYLFKYITKGEDRAMVRPEVEMEEKIKDEIKEFVDLRSVGSSEASWHILNFNISKNKPAVCALRVHLKDEHNVVFDMGNEEEVLETHRVTELTAFFNYNLENQNTKCKYVEFPEKYIYGSKEKKWRKRRNSSDTIGRVHTVHPVAGDVYYLRMLLHHEHCEGKTSFPDLMSIDGIKYETYQEVCRVLGLLQDDLEWDEALTEGSFTKMSSSLRELFVIIVLFCQPANPRDLFDNHYMEWADDFISSSSKNGIVLTDSQIKTLVVLDIQQRLLSWDKNLIMLNIATPTEEELNAVSFTNTNVIPVLIKEELDFNIDELRETLNDKQSKFTDSQKKVFDTVMHAVEHGKPLALFIDARGGTGKTYVLNAILAGVRIMDGGIVGLAVGATGIAANLLHLGRTLHSRFKVPLEINCESVCSINSQSTLAELIRMAKVIVWDEAPMAHRFQMEALDRTLRDLTGSNKPFGGKVIVLSGDFRQCLAVIQYANRAEVVNAAINRSPLWACFTVLQLKENMRVVLSQDLDIHGFDEFTLKLGNGTIEVAEDTDMVEIPSDMCMKIEPNTPQNPEAHRTSMKNLTDFVYPNLTTNFNKAGWMEGRAILAPTNKQVDNLNNLLADSFPGHPTVLTSSDELIDPDDFQRFNIEYLNSLCPAGLPNHRLYIKSGMPLMLMRNLNPKMGLCNGTRLIFKRVHKNHLLECSIVGGEHRGRTVLIPRVTLQPKERDFPFKWCRRQFPVRVSFAMTINKSQGQTLKNVGVWLDDPCFAHGQLYVAMSRVGSPKDIKFAIRGRDGYPWNLTSNVVYREVLIKGNILTFTVIYINSFYFRLMGSDNLGSDSSRSLQPPLATSDCCKIIIM